MGAAFEAGSILIAIRTASAQAIQGLGRVKAGLKSLGVSAIGVSKIVNAAGRRMQRTFAALGRMVKRFALVAKIALVAAGVAAGKMAVDFEASLSKIVGLVGVSREQVNAWRDDILEMGKEVGKTPTELADAMFFVTSAGLRGAEALEALRASAKAATAGLGETKLVADAVTSALNAYRGMNLSAADAAGVLVATVREGKAEADSLAGAFGRVLPVASTLGVTFDQVGAALAAMTRLGLSADESATSLRSTLNLILKPGNDAKKALDLVGLSTEGLQKKLREDGLIAVLQDLKAAFEGNEGAIEQVFPNVRALTGVLALVGNNADKARGIFERMADAGVRDLDKAFAEAAATMKFRWNVALAGISVTLIKLGDVIMPAVLPALEAIGRGFETMVDGLKELIVLIGIFGEEFSKTFEEEGIGGTLQKVVIAGVDFIIETVLGLGKFLRENFLEIVKVIVKDVAVFLGPSAIKIMKLLFSHVKAGLLQIANLIRFPFDLGLALLLNFGQLLNEKIRDFTAEWLRIIADGLELLPDFMVPDALLRKMREAALELNKSAVKFRDNVKDVGTVLDEAIAKTVEFAEGIDAGLQVEIEEAKAEIDELAKALKESGVVGDAIKETEALLRKALSAGIDTFKKALGEVTGEFGTDIDELIKRLEDRLAALRAAPPLISPGGEPGAPAGPETKAAAKSTGQSIAAAVREGLEAQQARVADTLATAVATGVINGIRRGAKAIEILADIGRQLFEKALTDAIESFKVAMSKAITELAGESKGLINGILNAAIALVGFLLSQLDKGSDSSRRFGRVGPEVDSSQLVRGVISGPTNVAIAEVGENLKRALSGVEERLDVIIGFLFEARGGFAFGGGPVALTAGNAATP